MAGGRSRLIDVREIEMLLRQHAERLAMELLPNGRRDGVHWCVGDISGTPGQSLKVNVRGSQAGLWCDYVDPKHIGGDCLDLIRQVLFGGDKIEAIKWAKSWLGLDELAPARLATVKADTAAMAAKQQAAEQREAESRMRGARALWHSRDAVPIAGTPAEAYLEGRGIRLARLGAWPGSLRYHPEVYNREAQCKIPAMLAMAVTPDGLHAATHRTFLQNCPRRGWTKIDSDNAKMVIGKIGGAFVPLRKGDSGKSMKHLPPGEPIIMCEGIEDALTIAMAKPKARVIAAYSVSNLGAIVFPDQVGPLVLACDRDAPGSKAVDALERAIARQQSRGVKVQIVMPPIGVKDFNEWLNAGGAAEGVAA